MRIAQIWANMKMVAEIAVHQNRDICSFLTMMSEPMPEESRPRKLQTEMIAT
jgi:hypothetical protein